MNSPITHSWFCERIVEDAQCGIIFADEGGIIRLWNSGAEAMFGYSAAEAIGQSMKMIIPEKHQPRHDEGYARVMETGITKYGREALAVPALRKDGSRISIEFTIVLLRSAEGGMMGAAAIVQDVTARWERDKALRARLAALEGKTKEAQRP